LRKARDVIGLSVFCKETGKELGTVHDLLVDEQFTVNGFLLDQAGWLKRGRYIPSEAVDVIGEDCLIVNDESAISFLDKQVPWNGLYTGRIKLKGKPVITKDGQQLGQLEDVFFREKTGTIIGYELSDGLIADLTNGRKTVYKPDQVTLGEDALIIS